MRSWIFVSIEIIFRRKCLNDLTLDKMHECSGGGGLSKENMKYFALSGKPHGMAFERMKIELSFNVIEHFLFWHLTSRWPYIFHVYNRWHSHEHNNFPLSLFFSVLKLHRAHSNDYIKIAMSKKLNQSNGNCSSSSSSGGNDEGTFVKNKAINVYEHNFFLFSPLHTQYNSFQRITLGSSASANAKTIFFLYFNLSYTAYM